MKLRINTAGLGAPASKFLQAVAGAVNASGRDPLGESLHERLFEYVDACWEQMSEADQKEVSSRMQKLVMGAVRSNDFEQMVKRVVMKDLEELVRDVVRRREGDWEDVLREQVSKQFDSCLAATVRATLEKALSDVREKFERGPALPQVPAAVAGAAVVGAGEEGTSDGELDGSVDSGAEEHGSG